MVVVSVSKFGRTHMLDEYVLHVLFIYRNTGQRSLWRLSQNLSLQPATGEHI